MKRFAGVAAIAFSAHAGLALAQPVFIEPSERPPSRAERSAPDGAGPSRAQGRSERESLEQQRPDGPARVQRGAQAEPSDPRGDPRSREPQRMQSQQRDREQAQRERQDEQRGGKASEPQRPDSRSPATQSAQPQRPEGRPDARQPTPQTAQPQKPESQPSASGTAQPDSRSPTPQTAQPQRPDNRSGTTDTARPGTAPAPSETQQPGSTAQRPDATQPGATQSGTAQTAPSGSAPATRQSAQGEQAEPEKRRIADTVRERVERNEIRPVNNLGVSVSVGAELPSRVQLQPLPSEIASIRPQYRDYRYTVSEREIVIVDPRSRRIVEVIERDGGRAGGNVFAAFEQRRDLRRWRRPDTIVIQQGVTLPPDAPYYDLPVELVERNPHWRGYQYVMTERDEVAIVEPRTHRVVEVVDRSATQSASGGGGPATTGTARQSISAGAGSRHEIVRIIMKDAQPGDINAVEQLKGTVLPREVVLRPLPAAASEQDSQLRGYHYALLGDDVLIVDPGTREVVDVIE